MILLLREAIFSTNGERSANVVWSLAASAFKSAQACFKLAKMCIRDRPVIGRSSYGIRQPVGPYLARVGIVDAPAQPGIAGKEMARFDDPVFQFFRHARHDEMCIRDRSNAKEKDILKLF